MNEINLDLKSDTRMFRIIQGDVGSGKTIVSLLTVANVIENKQQCAFMAPTEILAKQHFDLAKKIFINTEIRINFLTGKTDNKERRRILSDLENGKIDLIIGTLSLIHI